MKILIVGANGKVGRRLVPLLVERGHSVRSLLRDEDQRAWHEEAGAEAVVGDLEGDVSSALEGMDACVFTAGSGGSTGKDKTLVVDLWGAVKTYRACADRGVSRYVMVSARRAGDPDRGGEGIRPYLVAKHAADELLAHSGLDFTILRPGRLSDDEPSGRIVTATDLGDREGEIPRADVAEAVAVALENPDTIGLTVEMLAGDEPIEKALLGVRD